MTTLRDYPYWDAENLEQIKTQMRLITNIRKDDITLVQTFPSVFVMGRSVGKIPTSSADVAATDKIGDQSYDADYWYILVNDSGSAAWRRVALGSW